MKKTNKSAQMNTLNMPITIAIEKIFNKPDVATKEEIRQNKRDKWLDTL